MNDTSSSYHTVNAYFLVDDADAELTFLKSAFGGKEILAQRDDEKRIAHAEVQIGDSLVMIGQAGGPWKPRGGAIYLWIQDVDATYRSALAAGASSASAPEDKEYGHRTAEVLDPNGITWWISAKVSR